MNVVQPQSGQLIASLAALAEQFEPAGFIRLLEQPETFARLTSTADDVLAQHPDEESFHEIFYQSIKTGHSLSYVIDRSTAMALLTVGDETRNTL